MKTILKLLLFPVMLSTPCVAQRKPPWEFFGGYSFLRADVREYYKSTPAVYSARNHWADLNGWSISITENVNRRIGGTLEADGYYHSPTLSGTTTSQHVYSLLYGPRISFRKRRGTPFVEALIGGSHASVRAAPAGPQDSVNSLAIAAGGGLDLRLGTKAAVRVIQVDYLYTNLLPSTLAAGGRASHNNYRASAGLVFYIKPRS